MTEAAFLAGLAAGWTVSELTAWWYDNEPLPKLPKSNPPKGTNNEK